MTGITAGPHCGSLSSPAAATAAFLFPVTPSGLHCGLYVWASSTNR